MSNVILTEQQILENCIEDCFDGFKELCEEGQKLGESLGVVVQMQKEEIFDLMHRI